MRAYRLSLPVLAVLTERTFALLRSVGNPNSQNAIREAILHAYADCEREPDRLAS